MKEVISIKHCGKNFFIIMYCHLHLFSNFWSSVISSRFLSQKSKGLNSSDPSIIIFAPLKSSTKVHYTKILVVYSKISLKKCNFLAKYKLLNAFLRIFIAISFSNFVNRALILFVFFF